MVESTQQLAQLISKLEGLVDRFERAQGGSQPALPTASKAAPSGSSQLNTLLKDFDNEVISKIKPFEDAAKALGGDIIPTIVSNDSSCINRCSYHRPQSL